MTIGDDFFHLILLLTMRLRRVIAVLACTLTVPCTITAQSTQPVGLQVSALSTRIVAGDGSIAGLGVEGQVRFNGKYYPGVGKLSFGVGGQYSTHTSANDIGITITGAFFEPRLSLAKLAREKFGPYLAARIALLRQSNDVASSSSGSAFGGGGGFVYVLGDRVNVDVGVAGLFQNFGESVTTTGRPFISGSMTSYAAKIGLTVGVP